MITIQNLEVQFDVEGDDDREAFARLFREFMRRWAAEAAAERRRELELRRERSLGEVPSGELY